MNSERLARGITTCLPLGGRQGTSRSSRIGKVQGQAVHTRLALVGDARVHVEAAAGAERQPVCCAICLHLRAERDGRVPAHAAVHIQRAQVRLRAWQRRRRGVSHSFSDNLYVPVAQLMPLVMRTLGRYVLNKLRVNLLKTGAVRHTPVPASSWISSVLFTSMDWAFRFTMPSS